MSKERKRIRNYGIVSILPFLFFMFSFLIIQNETSAQEMHAANTSPSYQGGMKALKEFITRNLRYPEQARKDGISGIVNVNFVISKEGGIENIIVMKGLSAECDAEAVRVTGMTTGWIPGVRQGKAVNTQVSMPVEFAGENKFHPAVITGKVFERNTCNPVEGVFVIIKDTNIGSVTLPDGSYRLEIPSDCKYLQCFGVGYSGKEVSIDNHSTINIELDAECMTIDFNDPE